MSFQKSATVTVTINMGPLVLLSAFELFAFWLCSILSVTAVTSWNYVSLDQIRYPTSI